MPDDLSAVTMGTREGAEVLTEPSHVARQCCGYGTRRFGSMEPKWFRPHNVAIGHEVYARRGEAVGRGTVLRSYVAAVTEPPTTTAVREAAASRHADERDTLRLCTRVRAVRGELTPEEFAEIPTPFHPLLRHLQRPLCTATGVTVGPSDYTTMAQADGNPNPITLYDLRRKLGGIAKQKASGYSGNGPDLHALMPDV